MLFYQVSIPRRTSLSNLAKPQTFLSEKPRCSNSGVRFSLVFWMSLYKDYALSTCIHFGWSSVPMLKYGTLKELQTQGVQELLSFLGQLPKSSDFGPEQFEFIL